MNKIYKVIWSKVRNCYVAVSEIAKRNGKSCTSVNCDAKANRRHAGMALAIALSLSMAGGGVAWGENVDADKTVPPGSTVTYNLINDGITFTVASGGNVFSIDSVKSGNTININSGGQVSGAHLVTVGTDHRIYGCSIVAGINNNNVSIAGTITGKIFGGVSDGSVTNNHVTISGGTVGSNDYGGVYGGYSVSGNVGGTGNNKNTVTITGGTINGSVYGGKNNSNSNVLGNTVEISAGTTVNGSVFGGQSSGNAGGTGANEGNTVTITGGTFSGSVYGGEVYGEATGFATNNAVDISGFATIGASNTINHIRGGSTYSGKATGNTVNIDLSSDGII